MAKKLCLAYRSKSVNYILVLRRGRGETDSVIIKWIGIRKCQEHHIQTNHMVAGTLRSVTRRIMYL